MSLFSFSSDEYVVFFYLLGILRLFLAVQATVDAMLGIDGVEDLIQLLLHIGDTTGIVAGDGVHQMVGGMDFRGRGLIRLLFVWTIAVILV